jgi:hypothetical protein
MVGLLFLLIGGTILCAHLFLFWAGTFSLSTVGINFLFVFLCGILVYIVVSRLSVWSKEGFRISTFFHRWEKRHPEIANRTSLLIYLERRQDEVKRLGYSSELIEAEDEWLRRYILDHRGEKKEVISSTGLFLFACLVIPIFLFWFMRSDLFGDSVLRISRALFMQDAAVRPSRIYVNETIQVVRGAPATLTASLSQRLDAKDAFIHIFTNDMWRTFPARQTYTSLAFPVPAVRQRMEYYFSVGNTLSNRGQVTPLDPPTLSQASITVTPPAYTGKTPEIIKPLRPFAAAEGSEITIAGESTNELTEASFRIGNTNVPVRFDGQTISVSFTASQSGEISFSFTDRYGLTGTSRPCLMTMVPDASPTVEILSPKPIDQVPELLQQRVQARAFDDYQIQHLFVHSQVNYQESANRVERIWSLENEASPDVANATQLFVTYDWDLSQFNLFPGDEFTFYLEAWDNDAIHGSKSGRSQTHILRYATLAELLGALDEKERIQVEDLNELVEEQHKITRDAGDTIDKITEKIESQTPENEDRDPAWMEKKELEEIKKRQEKLVEEAKRIQEQLNEYREEAEQTLSNEEREQQGFTPETVEKMARIQELLDELVNQDTRQLLQKIDSTLQEMSKQITTEQLQDLKFSFEEFDQELNRTLSMLENAFQARQLEGLRNMAEELAQRQEHLQRETQKLAERQNELQDKLDALENNDNQQSAESRDQQDLKELQAQRDQLQAEQDMLEARQKQMQQDAQSLMDKMNDMQQSTEEESPQISQMLQQIQDQLIEQQLQAELSQATEQLKRNNMEQAQKHQKNAQQQLQEMAQQLQSQLLDMTGMEMAMDTTAIRRLVDRGLFLSNHIEALAEGAEGRRNEQQSLRLAQAFLREIDRIRRVWVEMSQTNPFMGREIKRLLDRSEERLRRAVEVGQGVKWVGLHETRQSVMALNEALVHMLRDMENMQQQMQQQSGAQSLQQQMQQLISQQKNLNDAMDQMRQMGEKGQQMLEQLQQLAQQQAQIRKEIEKMMQQYRHVDQLRNRLQGIYQEMKELEELLQAGENDERAESKEKRIMTRMLEAGTMQEQDEYGKQRKAETAKTGLDAESPNGKVPLNADEKVRQAAERPPEERIPPQYREALKNYYTRLAEQMAR